MSSQRIASVKIAMAARQIWAAAVPANIQKLAMRIAFQYMRPEQFDRDMVRFFQQNKAYTALGKTPESLAAIKKVEWFDLFTKAAFKAGIEDQNIGDFLHDIFVTKLNNPTTIHAINNLRDPNNPKVIAGMFATMLFNETQTLFRKQKKQPKQVGLVETQGDDESFRGVSLERHVEQADFDSLSPTEQRDVVANFVNKLRGLAKSIMIVMMNNVHRHWGMSSKAEIGLYARIMDRDLPKSVAPEVLEALLSMRGKPTAFVEYMETLKRTNASTYSNVRQLGQRTWDREFVAETAKVIGRMDKLEKDLTAQALNQFIAIFHDGSKDEIEV